MRVLYLSYDGLSDPLGYSQVFQYLKGLSASHRIDLVSYEKRAAWSDAARREALLAEVRNAGIRWRPLRYHKSPTALATAYDIAAGCLVAGVLVWRRKVDLVHARSYVAAVIALVLKAVFGIRFVFDMRGFWADEKVDNGAWQREGLLYRIAKHMERRFLLSADRVISLTHAAVAEMRAFDYLKDRMPAFEVITTCANLSHFRYRPQGAAVGERSAPFVLGYVGAVSFSYLFDEALDCFKLLQQKVPGARLLVLNRGEHELVGARLKAHGIDPGCVELRAVDYDELPSQMSRMHACVFFIRQAYAKIASAPTKLGEVLGCGVPCLSNTGVGDMTAILEGERVGVAVGGFGADELARGLERLLALVREHGIRERCRQVAERHFSLDEGVRAYARVYASLEPAARPLDARA